MIANFVLENATAPGTSATVNLGGAPPGRVSFASRFASGSPAYYFMDDGTQAEWGVGVFTAGAPNTIARATVLRNTAGTTSRLNFAGAVRVYNEIPAERSLWLDATGGLSASLAGNLSMVSAESATFQGAGLTLLQSSGGDAQVSGNNVLIEPFAGGGTFLYGNGVQRAEIDANGNLLFQYLGGLSPIAAGEGGIALRQAGTAIGLGSMFEVNHPGGHIASFGTAYSGSGIVFCFAGPNLVGSISLTAGGTSYFTTSDHRLKTVHGPSDGAAITQIPVYRGVFNAAPGTTRDIALAHEIAAVAPYAVIGARDAVDADGNIAPQQVDYPALIPALIARVRHLDSLIAALTARIAALEAGA